MNSPIVVLVIMVSFIVLSITIINLKVNGKFYEISEWFKKILKRK